MNPRYAITRALVRTPGRSAVKGLRAGGGPDPRYEDVAADHAAYVAALRDAGVAVTVLDPLEAYPDALFVEDPALVFREGVAVLLNPGAPSRAMEVDLIAPDLARHFEQIEEVTQGHADGGDVLVMGTHAFIGLSARTDRAGADNLGAILRHLGLTVTITAPPAGLLHLKTGCSQIDEETVLATAPLIASGLFDRYRVLPVPDAEVGGANVLRLADRVLVSDAYPAVAELLDRHGVRPVPVPTAGIAAIDAGLTCMSLRW